MPMSQKPHEKSSEDTKNNVQAVLLKAFSSSNANPVKPTITRGQREWMNYIAK